MPVEPTRYVAFVSYRHMPRDRQWAIRIMQELETYRTPKALRAQAYPDRIGHLFRDEDEIPASSDLNDQIKEALARSDHLIVVCSPDTPASRWVRREIELFQEMGKGRRVIPLLIAGEPEESYPPELRRRREERTGAEGTTETVFEEIEPIAADVRPRNDERRTKTERRALLRLAAALLGCKFDDLARRDEERRKAVLRRQVGATAAVLAVAAGSAWWWWDANLHIKTQYCANYAERWGMPVCVGELSAAQHEARTTSFRFHVRGGRVVDMARVNGSDFPVGRQDGGYGEEAWTDGVAEWRFADYRTDARWPTSRPLFAELYDETGKKIRQIGYDFTDDPLQEFARFASDAGTAERQSAAGSTLSLTAPPGQYEVSSRSSIGQHRLTFDAQGLLVRREFEPVGGGAKVADGQGAYGRTYEYDAKGLPARVRNLNALGAPLIEKSGIVSNRRDYDAHGDLTSVEWLAANESPRLNEPRFAKVVLVRNANGNIEKQYFLSEAGAPTSRLDSGIASQSQEYDERGNEIEEAYFGIDGRPALTTDDGIARTKLKYDARGNEIERSYFGLDGKPALEKKSGISRMTRRYDERRNEVARAFFGTDGKATLTSEGIARVTWRYDERGNLSEQAYFDADDKPTLNAVDGVAGIRWDYDKRSNQPAERSVFGVDGRLTIGKLLNYARVTWRYERGNRVEAAYFGADGKPALSKEGVSRITNGYDEHGHQIETKFFGVDGKPTLHKDGYARWTTRYDEHGNAVEQETFGLDGKLIINKKSGVMHSTYRYDDRGNNVEVAFFGLDGAPMLSVQGMARWISTYDERGHEIETAYFGVDGKPRLNVAGAARITKSYDERGNLVANAYFGTDGKPVIGASGTASAIYRYDTRGNRLEEAYFDIDGKPVLSGEGIARITWSYDERDRKVAEAYFGVDGKPTLSGQGPARMTWRYDERGNVVEMASFGRDGNLAAAPGNAARTTWRYDDHDRPVERVFFDAENRPIHFAVLVQGVGPGSVAESIGLRVGDLLLSYDGMVLSSTDQLIDLVQRPGDTSRPLEVRRGGETIVLDAPPGRLGVQIKTVRIDANTAGVRQ